MYRLPIIPQSIVVHLGSPDHTAKNIHVPFIEYIKNVASGELYANWPKEALKANILAIISFTLNRIYNEWYRSKGYDFDITSSSQYDQDFLEDRQFFESIYVLVDEMFQNYLVRSGQVQPLFASYCDGKNTTCDGLSQWGSVSLANQGFSALDILKKYYGNDIEIVTDTQVLPLFESYPGEVIQLGDAGDYIRILKVQLNRIGKNYPAIPLLLHNTIYFDTELENTIKTFQKIFSLPVTGNINSATWYKIKYLYNAVKNISNLYSEGIGFEEVEMKYPMILQLGDKGIYIRDLHYLLNTIAYFDSNIPNVDIRGEEFNQKTYQNVLSFQEQYGLTPTGKVDVETWNLIRDVYLSVIQKVPNPSSSSLNEFFPDRYLSFGMQGEDVSNLQRFLYLICEATHEIPGVVVSGEFDSLTEQSIIALQKKFGLDPTGVVTAATWYDLVEYQKSLK